MTNTTCAQFVNLMNKPIKFRAWDSENSKMIHWISMRGWMMDSLNGDHIMQFTGLLDKNGQEIYEGDIVSVVHGTGMEGMKSTREKRFYCEVYFTNGGFRYKFPQDYGNYRFGKHLTRTEVVGNIYEHHHLLLNTPTK